MDTIHYLGLGFGVALTPYNLITAFCGTLIGTIVGLLPGLGPVNGVALLIPIAYALGLPPETALILLAAVYLGCEYGGGGSPLPPDNSRAAPAERERTRPDSPPTQKN